MRRAGAVALFIFLLAMLAPSTAAHAQVQIPFLRQQEETPSLAPVLKETTSAVVNIAVVSRVAIEENPLYADPFFRRFFDLPMQPQLRQRLSAGSGVIIDAKNGYVLTNAHVIESFSVTVISPPP